MQQQIPLVLAFFLFVFTVLRFMRKSNGHGLTRKPLPGPWKLPIIGNIHQLVGSLPHRRFRDLAKKYGPIMQLQIGEVPTVVISSPEATKEVMTTKGINFVERPSLLAAKIMFYNCKDVAFAPYGDYWRQMRKVCTLELFSAKRVRSFRSIREEEVSNFIRAIHWKASSPINLSEMLVELSNSITARTSVGKKCKNQASFIPIVQQVVKALGGMNIADVFPSSRILYMISKERSRLQRTHKEADQILEDIINERRASRVGKKMSKNGAEDDLLELLLNLQDFGNHEVTNDGMKSIIMEMFSGGSETSSTLLEWTMSELMKNPSLMTRAQKEVRQVFDEIENVDETSVENLNLLKLIIKETLRLHPPVVLIPRACIKSCEVNGYAIEANSKVMINVWAIGRDPNYWTEAEKFNPERFRGSSLDYKGANFEFIPFGSGRRMCPGMAFGMANVEFPLAQLLYHFDWELANGATSEELDMEEAFGVTIKRKNHLKLIPISYRTNSAWGRAIFGCDRKNQSEPN